MTESRQSLTVAVVNPTESAQQLTLAVEGFTANGNTRLWRMTGGHVDAANAFGEKPQVNVEALEIQKMEGPLQIVPISINICQFGA